jgi:hypothetical protein
MTPSEIKKEMLKVKIPWFVGFAENFWFKVGRYAIPILILSLVPIGIVANNAPPHKLETIWSIIYLILGIVAGMGIGMLISHLIEGSFVKKQAKRLDISVWQWNAYAEELGLKSLKD